MPHRNSCPAGGQTAASGAVTLANIRRIRDLNAELRAAGLDIEEPLHCLGDSLCGISRRAAPPSRHDTGHELATEVLQALSHGVPVTIDVSAVVGSADEFEAFCRDLGERGVAPSATVSLYCEKPTISLRALALIACCHLGNGRRYVGLTDPASVPTSDWRYLWQRANSRWAVLPVYADTVAAGSPLLCDEHACSVLPLIGLKVPQASAWLPMRLNLERFADLQGRIREDALERALHTAVNVGERLLQALHWTPGPASDDARRNRRIAVQLDGIGDLVHLQGSDPGDLSVQRDLHRLLSHISKQLKCHSAALASQSGACPAISRLNPALQISDAERRRTWSEQWQSALERHALRHRNLLSMSPYAVIPRGPANRAAWADLLPLMALADSFSFVAPRAPKGWNLLDYKAFHCRAAAQIARRNSTCVVARKV